MPRLFHTADWQIGRQYGRFDGEDAALLAQARLAVVERIAALATEQAADAVLVAGDVFDLQAVADRTVRRLFHALAGFPGPWILLPGNHDAALTESVWTRARRLDCIPPAVHVVERPGVLTFEALGFAVLAAPLTQRQTHEDATAFFDTAETPPGLLRIGLAHGSVTGVLPEAADSPNPIAADRAATARLDYLALGDWHGLRRIDDRTWYSGTPEPDRFRGDAAGRVLRVDLAPAPGAVGGFASLPPTVEAIPVGRHRWRELAWRFDVATDVERFAGEIDAVATDDVLALQLAGRLDLDGDRRVRSLVEVARGRARALDLDASGLRLAPTDDEIATLQADGYVGDVLARLREAADDPVADAALHLLAGFLGEEAPGGGA